MKETLVRNSTTREDSETLEPHLFLLVEGLRPWAMSVRYQLGAIDEIVLGRGDTRSAQCQTQGGVSTLTIRIPDPWMSSVHARIERRDNTFIFRDAGSTNGSILNGQNAVTEGLADGDILELGQTFFLYRSDFELMANEPAIFDTSESSAPRGMLSLKPSLARGCQLLMRIVESDVSLVLIGASGTGKEVVAKTVHESSRRPGAFIAVNCGALPEQLMEAELFGYKKGAFTGAIKDHPGLILSADKGTLFLDEIGDLPLASQAALLRVLEEREVLPLGGTRPIPVDFRLLCATHRDIESLIQQGQFREDLYSRLSGFVLRLPSLADRKEDMGILLAALLRELCGEQATNIVMSNDVLRLLINHPWPRNIRQLRASLNTALALATAGTLDVQHFPGLEHAGPIEPASDDVATSAPATEPKAIETIELSPEQELRRQEIDRLLREHKGNISAVARIMGKARPQIQRWIRRYKLDPKSYK